MGISLAQLMQYDWFGVLVIVFLVSGVINFLGRYLYLLGGDW